VTSYGKEVREDKVSIRRLHILRECPKSFISQFSHDVMQMYVWSQQYNNALPDRGGLQNQNALVMEAMSVVRDEIAKVEEWRRHEAEKKAKQEADAGKAKSRRGK
jgi:hypothetical protein